MFELFGSDENGGGSVLKVLWSPKPNAKLVPLSHTVLSNKYNCPCHKGLFFEAYTPNKNRNAKGSWKLLYRQTGASTLGKEKWKSVCDALITPACYVPAVLKLCG